VFRLRAEYLELILYLDLFHAWRATASVAGNKISPFLFTCCKATLLPLPNSANRQDDLQGLAVWLRALLTSVVEGIIVRGYRHVTATVPLGEEIQVPN
jgi:hypothetical protein